MHTSICQSKVRFCRFCNNDCNNNGHWLLVRFFQKEFVLDLKKTLFCQFYTGFFLFTNPVHTVDVCTGVYSCNAHYCSVCGLIKFQQV